MHLSKKDWCVYRFNRYYHLYYYDECACGGWCSVLADFFFKVGEGLNLSGEKMKRMPIADDREALASDWGKVADDFRRALGFDSEKK